MLILLTDDLRGDLKTPLDRKVRDALLNLATAAYEGTHLLAASRLVFGDLQRLPELGPPTTGRFKEASTAGAEARALVSTIPALIQVARSGTQPRVEDAPLDSGREQLVFHLPLDHFADSSRVACAWLVAENRIDVDTYIAFGEAAATRQRGLCFKLRGAEGRGGSTHRAFQALAEQDGHVLCIVDSDRSSPTDAPGRTAVDVTAVRDALRRACRVAEAHVLPCRELENLLPASLVLHALPDDPRDAHRARVIAEQARLGLVDFADIKHLVRLGDVSERLQRLAPRDRAAMCLCATTRSALETVSTLVWSFGLAGRRGRT